MFTEVMPERRRRSGFTLLELMIVLVVVGILAAVAYPSYLEYLRRSALLEASNLLTQGKIAMDQYFQSRRGFAGAADAGGPCAGKTGTAFAYACTLYPDKPEEYTLTATGIDDTRAKGFVYRIDHDGSRRMSVDAGKAGDGWRENANCWIFKRGESC